MRGLFDTDGSIFNHSYKVKDKEYSYKKFCFTSASPPLITSVFSVLQKWGFNPIISKDKRQIRLESKKDMGNYIKTIGSSNPKHLKKYYNWGRIAHS